MQNNVTIIGGGVIGLCCAYYLVQEGHHVTLIDRGNITDGTSFGNAGYVSPSHFVPLASPGIVAKGLRWMLSSSSPFYIKPRADLSLFKWGFQFWKNASAATVARNAPPLLDLLMLSRELTIDIKQSLGNNFRMEEKGCFMLYKTAATEQHEIEGAEEGKKFGIETIVLSAAEVQKMEPEVQVDTRGGILYPIDCHLHPGDFMKTLRDYLSSRGVEFILEQEITGFLTERDKVTAVTTTDRKIGVSELILAAGSWMPVLLAKLKLPMLMQAGKGYSMSFENVPRNLHYPAILIENRVAMTPMGDDLRMGGTMEISGINHAILAKRVQAIYKAAKSFYPDLPVEFPAISKVWSGLRPLSPDGLPYIGRSTRYQNLIVAGGHAMLGLSLAAATGKLVAELAGHRETSVDLQPFSIERYS